MIDTRGEEDGFLSTSLRLFAIAFPLIILGRILAKWWMSDNARELVAWVRDEWVAEIVIALIVTALVSLFDGYKKSLGPVYGSREDRHDA